MVFGCQVRCRRISFNRELTIRFRRKQLCKRMKLDGYRKVETTFWKLRLVGRAHLKRSLASVILFLFLWAAARAACAQTTLPISPKTDTVLVTERALQFAAQILSVTAWINVTTRSGDRAPDAISAKSPQFNQNKDLKVVPAAGALATLSVNSCAVVNELIRLGRIRYA